LPDEVRPELFENLVGIDQYPPQPGHILLVVRRMFRVLLKWNGVRKLHPHRKKSLRTGSTWYSAHVDSRTAAPATSGFPSARMPGGSCRRFASTYARCRAWAAIL